VHALQIKTIPSAYAAGIAEVTESEKLVQVDKTFMCLNCSGSNRHIRYCVVFFVPCTSMSIKLILIIFHVY
jgi:hypothetical protein